MCILIVTSQLKKEFSSFSVITQLMQRITKNSEFFVTFFGFINCYYLLDHCLLVFSYYLWITYIEILLLVLLFRYVAAILCKTVSYKFLFLQAVVKLLLVINFFFFPRKGY